MIRIEILIKDVDYSSIADKVMPFVMQKLSEKGDKTSKLAKLISGMKDLPGKIVKAALSVLPQQTKEELAVYFLTEYKDEIVKNMMNLAKEQQVAIEIEDVKVEKI
jgi:hypothetical protein